MEKKLKRKELLNLPDRDWTKHQDREYKSVLVVPSGKKHDSGYMCIAIIGEYEEKGEIKYEICSYPDDINWQIPDSNRGSYQLAHLRTDCWYPEGILHFWGNGTFKVGWSSSTEITFIPHA